MKVTFLYRLCRHLLSNSLIDFSLNAENNHHKALNSKKKTIINLDSMVLQYFQLASISCGGGPHIFRFALVFYLHMPFLCQNLFPGRKFPNHKLSSNVESNFHLFNAQCEFFNFFFTNIHNRSKKILQMLLFIIF